MAVNDFILANKHTLDNCPKELCEMIYTNEVEGYKFGFWDDFDELLEYCRENDLDVPTHVWCTRRVEMSMDAEYIVEEACEELYEDAYDMISKEDIKELQEYLDQWCKKQTATSTYEPDKNNLILISSEDVKKRWNK